VGNSCQKENKGGESRFRGKEGIGRGLRVIGPDRRFDSIEKKGGRGGGKPMPKILYQMPRKKKQEGGTKERAGLKKAAAKDEGGKERSSRFLKRKT